MLKHTGTIFIADEDICTSSVLLYFESQGFTVSPVPWCMRTSQLSGLSTPVLSSSVLVPNSEFCGTDDTWEWLGAVACNIDL